MAPSKQPRRAIVTLGEAMLRLSAPHGERLCSAERLRSHVAGSEANVARALAALGVPVRWISALPCNPLGERVLSELRAAGVDTSYVQRAAAGRLGLFFAEPGVVPRSGRVYYDRADSAFARMSELDERALERAAFAVVSGITPAIGTRSRRLVQRFAAAALSAGARLCVDVNYRRLLWSPRQARRAIAPLLAQADIVVCSERDAVELFDVSGAPRELIGAFAERWAPHASIVAVTLGAEGSILLGPDGVLEQGAREVEVVDRFGAGDAFMAGLVFGIWSGHRTRRALQEAATLAELACTVHGDAAEFAPWELEAALAAERSGGIVR
jgi:2-dehydro-3-deoxygluconokinase